MSTQEHSAEIPDPPARGGLDPIKPIERPGQEPAQDPTEAWWDAMGEDGQAIRDGKKWKNPADLAKGYRAEQAARTKAEQERAALVQYIEALEEQQEAAKQAQRQPAQQGQGSGQEVDWKEMAEGLKDADGEYDMAQVLQVASMLGAQMSYAAAVEFIKNELSQFSETQIKPLAEDREVNLLAEQLGRVEQVYGEERFDELTERIDAAAEKGEDLIKELGARGAYAEMAFRVDQERLEQQARQADGHALTTGGRRAPARKKSQEEIEIGLMEGYRRRIDDGL